MIHSLQNKTVALRAVSLVVLFVGIAIGTGSWPFRNLSAEPSSEGETELWVTDTGTGPDKWASVWFLARRASIDVLVLREGDPVPPGAKTFDMPDAAFDRSATRTTLDTLIERFGTDTLGERHLATIVREIEIDAWRTRVSLNAEIVERAFRGMQLAYGRERVGERCYSVFFDAIAVSLEQADEPLSERASAYLPRCSCLDANRSSGFAGDEPVVRHELGDVLAAVASGERVTFVDTREASEFAEGHLPGAVHLPLRRIDAAAAASLAASDRVIAYCVKDFRGFEAARALRRYGIDAGIMTPYGIRGWLEAGLPVVGARGMSEKQASQVLREKAGEI